MASPDGCRVVTELMPTWRNLWTQRLRWQRGALENLGAYGPTPTMLRYWAQQLGIGYSVIALSSFWLLILVTVLASDQWVWFPFWLGVGSIFVVDRVDRACGAAAGGRACSRCSSCPSCSTTCTSTWST